MSNRLSQEIAPHLPYLRRYARALTGSQQSGDAHVVACLDALVADPTTIDLDRGAKVGLYRLFHSLWAGLDVEAPLPEPVGVEERTTQERLAAMAPDGRQLLLLTALEGFSHADAAAITGHAEADVTRLVAEAVAELESQTATQVLIIEDEPLISLDLSEIAESLGHGITGIARTAAQAVAGARANPPGLVLADIQLADGSSGLDAVREILEHFEVPVIFVTSFPERLLTGQRPEPAFLITKPYDPNAVKATISQALFFRTAASLAA